MSTRTKRHNLPREVPVRFRSKGKTVFGVLHLPPKKTESVLIFANGFPDNMLEIHIIIASARYFSERGFAFLRFNPRGRWPSKGTFTKMDVSDTVEDLRNAILFARRKGFEKIGLIGHSLGGVASILVPKNYVRAVALWEASSPKYVHKRWTTRKMKKQMEELGYAVHADYGIVVGSRMYGEFGRLGDISESVRKIGVPVLIVAGTRAKFMTNLSKTYFKVAPEPKELRIILGASHTFDNLKHEQKLFGYTFDWFNKWL